MTSQFAPGDDAIWTGTRHLFERPVRIVAARRPYLASLGETPDGAPVVYDIHDPAVIKGTVYAIPADQLHAPEG